VFSTVSYAVGSRYSYVPNARQIGGQFQPWIEGKIFGVIEEIHMEGRREILDALKPMVTNLNYEIEGKGADKRMIENRCNFGFCTNYKDAILKSRDDRRYSILFTAQQSANDLLRDGMDGNYFPDLWDWLRNGGYSHVAHFLSNYAIPHEFDPAGSCHRAPITSSTAAAITKSMSGVEHEVIEASEGGVKGFLGGWVSSWAMDNLMKDRGYRISHNRQSDVLLGMGFERAGRASSPIPQEDDLRPVLYCRPGTPRPSGNIMDYLKAQGYPY
jgi:hypothetical protein